MHDQRTTSLYADLRAMPRGFWVLFAGTFINRFGTFVFPFLTIFLTRGGYNLADVGMAVGAYGVGGLASSLWGGWFSDRIGRRNTIVMGTFANALSVLALYFAHGLPAIVALTICTGLTGSIYAPAANALLADLVPEPGRVRAYSALRLAGNLGFACATSTAGFLAGVSFFWLFIGDSITTASYGVLALMALPHGLRTAQREARWSEAIARLRCDRQFWVLFTGTLCSALIFNQFGSSYSLEIIRRGLRLAFGPWNLTSEQVFGVLIGWNGLLIAICELPLTGLTRRFEPRSVMAIGYTLLGAGFAMNAFSSSIIQYFWGMTVFTIGEMLSLPISSAYLARIAPESMRGRYMGAHGMAWSLASVAGPAIGLQLYGTHPMTLWLGCGALGLIAATVMLRSKPPAEMERLD